MVLIEVACISCIVRTIRSKAFWYLTLFIL